ncbi:MAG: hypothetical protein JXB39_01620 [Deltaproteobacteria bacterium]|nr:hypothetical protein [Deltaproteobacteria bacterium]
MQRLLRRLRAHCPPDEPLVHPGHIEAAESPHARVSRAVRMDLRRLDPVVLEAPRWSSPQSFLEEVALSLAVGNPPLGCRTVGLRPLLARPRGQAWQFLLRVAADLGGARANRPVPIPAEPRGFRHALADLLEEVQASSPWPVALLAHGFECLEVDVAEDFLATWDAFRSAHRDDARCVLLAAGAPGTAPIRRAVEGWSARRVRIPDFGVGEAAEVLAHAGRREEAPALVAARFTGGMPALVRAVGDHASQKGHLPQEPPALVGALGPIADEIRGAVDIVASDDRLAARLDLLLTDDPVEPDPRLDEPLIAAGLARRVMLGGAPATRLRAPAIAALVG